MKSKTDRFKQKKTYSTPDIKELNLEKLRHQWDFEVFGLCASGCGNLDCCPEPNSGFIN